MMLRTLLLETLNKLSSEELDEFKSLIKLEKSFPLISKSQLRVAHLKDVVELMVKTFSQECVEVTTNVLEKLKRTDLLQRLSDVSSGTKDKHFLVEPKTALIQKEETLASVIELLLKTLADLSDREMEDFKQVLLSQTDCYKRYSEITWRLLMMTDLQDTVLSMVQTYGQRSVEKTKEILEMMKRTGLADSSSVPKKKLSMDEHLSALIHKVATMTALKQLLLETLNNLSHNEFKKFRWFLQLTFFQKCLPQIPWRRLKRADRADLLVDVMVERCGQQSVELTMEVFMDMNRPDLVQKLSESSSGLASGSSAEVFGMNTTEGEKPSVDERWPALIQKEETLASVIELLVETLSDLSNRELKDFKQVLLSQIDCYKRYSDVTWRMLRMTDLQDTVFLIVQTYSQQSVEKTKEVLKRMRRNDLVQRLSDSSSGAKQKLSVDEHRSALIQKVATMAAVKQLLIETLNEEELEKFKKVLQLVVVEWGLPDISRMLSHTADRVEIADLMVETYGHQSVDVTKKVFVKMNRTDLVQRLSSSTPKEKHSGDKHRPTQLERILLETLNGLSHKELKKYKWFLQFSYFKRGLPQIPWSQLEKADRAELVDLMMEMCDQQSVEVTREVFMDMNRTDLVQRLSETSSGLGDDKDKQDDYDEDNKKESLYCPRHSGSLELEGCGSCMVIPPIHSPALKPEVNSTDADEAPTYSLQSEAGNFECSVSALRWVCKEKVSLKYQFWSWEGHMERMASRRYMPAGPLMDISVISGKLDEVYLPHWICVEDNPSILDRFAVLHIDNCGDVVEKVSEVTPSHVKLSEPVFSPRAVLIKFGIPCKIKCQVLIYYQPNASFLKLHVYLIPCDPALKQIVDKKESSYRYKAIIKPHPDKYLKMHQGFILTTDMDTAKILPKKLTLRYDSQDPNFYEVFIKNPDRNFYLTLLSSCKNKDVLVWTCEIREDDFPSSIPVEATGSSGEATGVNTLAQDSSTVDEDLSEQFNKATITPVREKLLKMLEHLKEEEFKGFKWYLEDSAVLPGPTCIPKSKLEKADKLDLVELMMQTYNQQCVEVTKRVFKKIKRNDLVQML
ncbi:uncharacterized protein LOC108899589 isoform X1 [Lates calcarifer]|uniref:Uncharacterized protein LOC108899589 isoform X1 n=1 Tax=Lates calcarifer TaxID=8187 RepID=A0AAJ7VIL5_LATCA|nr:uncharacterized protein LOC108899589 isoform X1 [Lates calcarifer]